MLIQQFICRKNIGNIFTRWILDGSLVAGVNGWLVWLRLVRDDTAEKTTCRLQQWGIKYGTRHSDCRRRRLGMWLISV